MTLVRSLSRTIIVPTLLLPEVAAAVGRGRDDADLARRFAASRRRLPHLILVPLDEALTVQAADVAAQNRLGGSDAAYVVVALRFGSTFVTLDRRRRQRLAAVVSVCLPASALAGWDD
jgi:predicted nucleic acid-binding protein